MANVLDDQANGGWTGTIDSGANAASQLVAPAPPDSRNRLWKVAISISGAAVVTDMIFTVKDGSTIIWKEIIGAGARGAVLDRYWDKKPLYSHKGAAMTFDLQAGGAAVVSSMNVAGDTRG